MRADLSSIYADSEELIGKWFKRTGLRRSITLSTKFGMIKNTKFKGIDSSAEYCKKACEASLKALGTDYIDLCKHLFYALLIWFVGLTSWLDYLHRANPDTPIEETMRAMAGLQR